MNTSFKTYSIPHGMYPIYSSTTGSTYNNDGDLDFQVTILRSDFPEDKYCEDLKIKNLDFYNNDLITGYESELQKYGHTNVTDLWCYANTNRVIIPQIYQDLIPCRFTNTDRHNLYPSVYSMKSKTVQVKYVPFPANTTYVAKATVISSIYDIYKDEPLDFGAKFKSTSITVNSKVNVVVDNESLGDISLVFQKNEFFEIKLDNSENATDLPDGVTYGLDRIKGSIEKSGEYNINVTYNSGKTQIINILIPFYRRIQ